MSATPGKWIVSTNEERWSAEEEFDTKEEAVNAAAEVLSIAPGDTFYVGRIEQPHIVTLDAGRILEDMDQIMADSEDGGEYSEGWLADVEHVQEEELENALNQVWLTWLVKHGHTPKWFIVREMETCSVPVPENGT